MASHSNRRPPRTEARNIIFSNFDPDQVVHVSVDPRIREQEFGNLQGGVRGISRIHAELRWYTTPGYVGYDYDYDSD